MNRTHSSALLALLMASVAAACGGARASSDFVPGPAADFRTASTAEVRTAEDQVILSGSFVETAADSDDVERKAALTATNAGASASGAAEVESCRGTDCDTQEVEFDIVNAPPRAVLRLMIDGKEFGRVTSDERGRASVERDVQLPR